MSAGTYQLTGNDCILTHGPLRPRLMRDSDEYEHLDIEALVASGDCFITIATSLDDSLKFVKTADSMALPQIEKAISILMYLQRHYRIVRKPSEHYQ